MREDRMREQEQGTQNRENDLSDCCAFYNAHNFSYTIPVKEEESSEYNAHVFELNGRQVKYRKSKITPTKAGQFVTLWKRNKKGIIEPFEFSDPIDLFIISVRTENSFGQFIFSKSVLCEQGIVSTSVKEGKRAMRVYPPWDVTTSKQAQKTQLWQKEFFIEMNDVKKLDRERLKSMIMK
jgi:hypothetical protein